MSSLNKFMGIGRLVRNPEVVETKSDTVIVKFSIAINEKYKGEDKTEWVNVVCFGNAANYVREWVTKGALVYIEGKLQTSTWENKEGEKRSKVEVVAFTVQGLTKGEEAQSEPVSEPVEEQSMPF